MTYWDYHIDNHERYIRSYGEGEGSPNRIRLFKYIPVGASVLDVGCGPGCNIGHAIQTGHKISYKGVDNSVKFIEACKNLFPEYPFEVQDANQLNEPDNSFDLVILQDVLEHLSGYEQAIDEACRVAKSRVLICMWIPLHDGEDKTADMGDGGYRSEYNSKKFMKYIESKGTVTTDKETEHRTHWYYILDI
ncbi:class I SAM-dependent methyltransferase [bacterium]|nr:class I SAM-dependent methyltransferase [bacterium]